MQNVIIMGYEIQKEKKSEKKMKISVIFSENCLKTFNKSKEAFKYLI